MAVAPASRTRAVLRWGPSGPGRALGLEPGGDPPGVHPGLDDLRRHLGGGLACPAWPCRPCPCPPRRPAGGAGTARPPRRGPRPGRGPGRRRRGSGRGIDPARRGSRPAGAEGEVGGPGRAAGGGGRVAEQAGPGVGLEQGVDPGAERPARAAGPVEVGRPLGAGRAIERLGEVVLEVAGGRMLWVALKARGRDDDIEMSFRSSAVGARDEPRLRSRRRSSPRATASPARERPPRHRSGSENRRPAGRAGAHLSLDLIEGPGAPPSSSPARWDGHPDLRGRRRPATTSRAGRPRMNNRGGGRVSLDIAGRPRRPETGRRPPADRRQNLT